MKKKAIFSLLAVMAVFSACGKNEAEVVGDTAAETTAQTAEREETSASVSEELSEMDALIEMLGMTEFMQPPTSEAAGYIPYEMYMSGITEEEFAESFQSEEFRLYRNHY